MERAIVTQIRINRPGQIKHFQIKLPVNAKYIIGVEIGGRLIQFDSLPNQNMWEEYQKEQLEWETQRQAEMEESALKEKLALQEILKMQESAAKKEAQP